MMKKYDINHILKGVTICLMGALDRNEVILNLKGEPMDMAGLIEYLYNIKGMLEEHLTEDNE